MKWDQRVNITFSCNGPVKDDGAEREDNTDHKAPDIENGSADQYDDAHKFHGVAKFKAGLGIVGNGDKGHIQHGFGVEPPGLYRIFSQHDTCDNAEGSGKHIWGVYRCQAQTVDGKFKDEKLPDERNITGVRKPDKPEMTDELKELNEEMLAHYQEGRYIVTVQEDKGIPILKQKDGKVYQPIFTDVQEVKKFQNLNKGVTLKTAVVEGSKIPEILSPEAFGVAVNPFGVNLQLQINRKPAKTKENKNKTQE